MRISLYIILIISQSLHAAKLKLSQGDTQTYQLNDDTYLYQKPKFWDFTKNIKEGHSYLFDISFSKKSIPYWGAIALSTGITYIYDEDILRETQSLGRKLNIPNRDNTKTAASIGGVAILRVPTDVGSTLYYIGDGWTQLAIINSFLGYGLVNDDYRSMQVAKQITYGLLMSSLGVQVLKRTTGRQSPYVSTHKRGNWRFFPNQNDYNKNVSSYDAFPSGHVTTAMMTFTVIAENYPEYKYIKPVGYTLISLLAFQMVNNGVHWASDYPLALGLGYVYGKTAAYFGRDKRNNEYKLNSTTKNTSYQITPIVLQYKGLGINYTYSY